MSPKQHDTDSLHPALAETLRALTLRKGPASDLDRPRRTSSPHKPLPGQLELSLPPGSDRDS